MTNVGVIIITGFITIITNIITSWITWFFTRKKYDAEVDHSLIENLKESLEFYKKLSDDNTKRLEETLRRSSQLEEEVNQLKSQVISMMSTICTNLTCKLRKGKPLEE
jgi:hypothetical protein|nr:MAG TPA: CHD-like protein [Crassvirales sp.]